jgi:hypothetical protein
MCPSSAEDENVVTNDHLRVVGLPQPPLEPNEWLLHEAHTRVTQLIKSLKESGGISAIEAYDAPQDARLAHQNGEYDVLYNFLEHLGSHEPYVIEGAVRGMRVDAKKNTCPALTRDLMAAASAVRAIILDLAQARSFFPEDESLYYAFAIKNVDGIAEVLEIMKRGIMEPSEIERLLEQKRTVEKSLSGGVL